MLDREKEKEREKEAVIPLPMLFIYRVIPSRHHREPDGLPSTVHEDVVDYSDDNFRR